MLFAHRSLNVTSGRANGNLEIVSSGGPPCVCFQAANKLIADQCLIFPSAPFIRFTLGPARFPANSPPNVFTRPIIFATRARPLRVNLLSRAIFFGTIVKFHSAEIFESRFHSFFLIKVMFSRRIFEAENFVKILSCRQKNQTCLMHALTVAENLDFNQLFLEKIKYA